MAIWPTAFDTFQSCMGIPFYPCTNSTKANNKNHLQKTSQIKPFENVTKFMCLERTVTFQNGYYTVAPFRVI